MQFRLKHAALALLGLITAGLLSIGGAIGPRVGPKIGPTIGPAIGQRPGGIPLILMFGDSQIVGNGTTDTSDPAENDAATQSTSVVRNFDMRYALAAGDPIAYQTDITGGVRPYTVGGAPGMGMQTSIGRTLTTAGVTSVIASFGIFGMSLAQALPTATYPTVGPNVWTQMVTRTHALEATWGARARYALISLGNNDGANATDAGNVAANSATEAAALRAAFPGITIGWIRINADTVNAAGFTFEGTAITQQQTFFAGDSAIIPIDSDDRKLASDHAHFTSDTADEVGPRAMLAGLDAIAIPRARPSVFPAIAGWGPQKASAGTTDPAGYGGELANDLEILASVGLTASGANNALATPTGWTLIDTLTSTSGGATLRAAFYKRTVTAAMLAANRGHSAATTVSAANGDNYSEIITLRGVSAGVAPTVEAFQLSANNAFNTTLNLTGVTSLGANRSIVMFTVHFRTNATANAVSMSAGGLTGLTAIRNGTRASGGGNDCTFDVQIGQLPTQGPSGSMTATIAQNSISVGAVLAITP